MELENLVKSLSYLVGITGATMMGHRVYAAIKQFNLKRVLSRRRIEDKSGLISTVYELESRIVMDEEKLSAEDHIGVYIPFVS